jgi:predicted RNA-binding Zn-ribbon protein involved in translation (DUF1610 family)
MARKQDSREWTGLGNGPRIVTLDVETFPNLVFTWGLFQQNVGVNQIVRDWSLASVCWKWLDEKKAHYLDCSANPLDDGPLLEKIWEVLDSADIVVGQNSKHFDIRKINARLIENGYRPPSPYKQIDTKVEARKVAMFTSNRLEWLSAHLSDVPKDKHKDFPGFELWSECLNGNPKAWAAMRRYNPIDVLATEKVYLKLRPWIEGHPNIANYLPGQTAPACPKCGSENIQHRGTARTQTGIYRRMQCIACGGWSRSRYTLNTIAERRALLTN